MKGVHGSRSVIVAILLTGCNAPITPPCLPPAEKKDFALQAQSATTRIISGTCSSSWQIASAPLERPWNLHNVEGDADRWALTGNTGVSGGTLNPLTLKSGGQPPWFYPFAGTGAVAQLGDCTFINPEYTLDLDQGTCQLRFTVELLGQPKGRCDVAGPCTLTWDVRAAE